MTTTTETGTAPPAKPRRSLLKVDFFIPILDRIRPVDDRRLGILADRSIALFLDASEEERREATLEFWASLEMTIRMKRAPEENIWIRKRVSLDRDCVDSFQSTIEPYGSSRLVPPQALAWAMTMAMRDSGRGLLDDFMFRAFFTRLAELRAVHEEFADVQAEYNERLAEINSKYPAAFSRVTSG